MSKIWDAVSDPMMGVISDRTKSRLGRRRPYFLAGTFLVFLSFAGLWLPVRLGTQGSMFLFALVVWLFHETVCSMVLVPFYGLGGDLTSDYRERNSIMFSRLFISTLTVILVAVLPKLIVARFADPRLGYAVMGAGFGLLFSLPWLAIFLTFRERADYRPDPSLTIRAQILEPLRLRSFRQLMLIFIAGYGAIDLMSSLCIYYVTYYLGRTDYNLILGSLLVGQLLLLPVGLFLAGRIGKRNALIAGFAWWAAMIVAMAALTPAWPGWSINIIVFLMGGGSGAAAFLPWAIFPDVADVGELVYGARREGVFSGFLTFARKCTTALAMGVFGVALDMAGFVKPLTRLVRGSIILVNQAQPTLAVSVIRAGIFLVPLCLLGLGIYVASRFRLTPEIHAKLQTILRSRRGETIERLLSDEEIAALRESLI